MSRRTHTHPVRLKVKDGGRILPINSYGVGEDGEFYIVVIGIDSTAFLSTLIYKTLYHSDLEWLEFEKTTIIKNMTRILLS